jgi:hypothetical protein
MQTKLESRRHAEVAAPAAESPEEFRILLGGRLDHGPVRRDYLGTDQVVARQAVLGGQVADAAAEREPADAGRAHDAAGSH